MLELPAIKIAVLGLAFKANTDDLRESPSNPLIEHLLGKGRDTRVYDPHIRLDDTYGSKKNYNLRAIIYVSQLLIGDADELLGWAEAVVVTTKPEPAVLAKIVTSGKPVVDRARRKRSL